MFNKLLVFGGMALAAILIIENIVGSSGTVYVFISSSKAYMLSFVSILIGIGIGYGLKGFLNKEDTYDESTDF